MLSFRSLLSREAQAASVARRIRALEEPPSCVTQELVKETRRDFGAMPRRPKLLKPYPIRKSVGTSISEVIEHLFQRLGWIMGADGNAYLDTRAPFLGADPAVDITLAATDKALYSADKFPSLGSGYFNSFVGKKIKIRQFGKATSAATPGNWTWDIYFGTGADANGVLIGPGTAVAWQANQTGLSWWAEWYIHTVSLGATGTLWCDGWSLWNVALILSTAQPVIVPTSLGVVSGACDLTTANIISVQGKRSGSTAETIRVQDMEVVAMN